jgi:hypothetical protein
MAHEDSAGDAQRIEQTNQVTSRMQWRVQGCVCRSRAVSIAAHIWSNCSISGAAGASSTGRFSHLTQHQASTNGSPSREDSAASNSCHRLSRLPKNTLFLLTTHFITGGCRRPA